MRFVEVFRKHSSMHKHIVISVQLEHLNKKELYTSIGCTNHCVLRHYRRGKHGVLKESNGVQTTYFEDNVCGVYEMDGQNSV